MYRFALLVLLAACAADPDPQPIGEGGKADGTCPSVPIGMTAWTAQPYSCGAVDTKTSRALHNVDRFWDSNLPVCGCGPDFPIACEGAYAANGGWIYTNVALVDALGTSFGTMAIEYAYAHEYGHELQSWFSVSTPTMEKRELGADCLAGYYLEAQVCEGRFNEYDVRATLQTACLIADGTGDPAYDENTHGTCIQRVIAVARGMYAYLHDQAPIDICTL